ncbi:MAG: alginate export family protein [Candidatus Tectimicrobiota bacterium]
MVSVLEPSQQVRSAPVLSPPLPLFMPRTALRAEGRLAPGLSWGGKAEVEYLSVTPGYRPFGSNTGASALEPELSLGLALRPNPYLQGFMAVKLLGEFTSLPQEPDQHETGVELTEAFLLYKPLWDERLVVQIGRQTFSDAREWLYDDELDAVRLFYRCSQGTLELAASRGGLLHKDILRRQATEQQYTYLIHPTYAPHPSLHLAAYLLWRQDYTSARDRSVFLGLRASGRLRDDLTYWLEAAHVRGQDGGQHLRGFGVDLGATYTLPLPLTPAVTLGWAFGTGDGEADDATDSSFRQTGLHGNKGKFTGVSGFQYYGEVLDPELSNLLIWTAGFGIRPSRRSSLDLVYHDYYQHQAATDLREARLPAVLNGRHTHVGREIDLVLGVRDFVPLEITLVLGYFAPGKAWDSAASGSVFVRANLEVTF